MTTAESPVPRTGGSFPRARKPRALGRAVPYRSRAVRHRILEYCGAEESGVSTAWEMAGYGGARHLGEADGSPVVFSPPDPLERLMDEGADVTRCLGDDRGSLVLLDVDYVNHEDPAESYRDPALCRDPRAGVPGGDGCFAPGLRPFSLTRQVSFIGRVSSRARLAASMGRIRNRGKYLALGRTSCG
jgi:hypothetical protein